MPKRNSKVALRRVRLALERETVKQRSKKGIWLSPNREKLYHEKRIFEIKGMPALLFEAERQKRGDELSHLVRLLKGSEIEYFNSFVHDYLARNPDLRKKFVDFLFFAGAHRAARILKNCELAEFAKILNKAGGKRLTDAVSLGGNSPFFSHALNEAGSERIYQVLVKDRPRKAFLVLHRAGGTSFGKALKSAGSFKFRLFLDHVHKADESLGRGNPSTPVTESVQLMYTRQSGHAIQSSGGTAFGKLLATISSRKMVTVVNAIREAGPAKFASALNSFSIPKIARALETEGGVHFGRALRGNFSELKKQFE